MEQPHSTTAQRKWKQLTEKDRYRLEAYFNAGLKTQEIANRMGYSKRTIERERKLGLTPQLKPATKNNKLSIACNLEPCYTVTAGGNQIDFSTLE